MTRYPKPAVVRAKRKHRLARNQTIPRADFLACCSGKRKERTRSLSEAGGGASGLKLVALPTDSMRVSLVVVLFSIRSIMIALSEDALRRSGYARYGRHCEPARYSPPTSVACGGGTEFSGTNPPCRDTASILLGGR